jgi:rSAM/selenodomain-associated transferase 2
MMRHGFTSVIIPVYHESDIINDQIRHLKEISRGKKIEIIVVDGAPERDTLKAIRDGKVKKIASKKGRGAQMNAGASSSKGDILLFLHVDTSLPQNAFELVGETLSDGRFLAGAFTLRFDNFNPILNSLIFLHDLRGAIMRIPYGDQAIFIRKEIFEELNGYREYRLFEDVDLMERLKKRRSRIKILREKVITSGRRYHEYGAFRGLFRNLFIIGLYKLGVHPDKLAKLY